MTKTKELTIFNKFKLGDKVWYEEPMQPFRKRIPGIVEKDKIQTVGKRRDEYITSGISPFIEFTDMDVSSILHRKKEFPGEKNRMRLHHSGMEQKYISWKEKPPTLSDKETRLLKLVKEMLARRHGLYECNYDVSEETINSLVRKGIIRRMNAPRNPQFKMLVPTGVEIPKDLSD